jgi:hypothetical protein
VFWLYAGLSHFLGLKTLFEQHKLGDELLPDGPIVSSPDGMDQCCTEEPLLVSLRIACFVFKMLCVYGHHNVDDH